MRLWMWSRRNPAVSGMAASLVLALMVGLAGITWKWREAEQRKTELAVANQVVSHERNAALAASEEAQRRRVEAEQEVATANAVVDFLVHDILAQASPEKNPRSRGVTVEDALDLASPAIGTRFAGKPEVKARVRDMIGRTYQQLGEHDKAEPHLRHRPGACPPQTGRDGSLDPGAGERPGDVAARKRQARRSGAAVPPLPRRLSDHPGARERGDTRAQSTISLSCWPSGAGWRRRNRCSAVSLRSASRGSALDDPSTLRSMSNLGAILKDLGRLDEAEPLIREAPMAVRGPSGRSILKHCFR